MSRGLELISRTAPHEGGQADFVTRLLFDDAAWDLNTGRAEGTGGTQLVVAAFSNGTAVFTTLSDLVRSTDAGIRECEFLEWPIATLLPTFDADLHYLRVWLYNCVFTAAAGELALAAAVYSGNAGSRNGSGIYVNETLCAPLQAFTLNNSVVFTGITSCMGEFQIADGEGVKTSTWVRSSAADAYRASFGRSESAFAIDISDLKLGLGVVAFSDLTANRGLEFSVGVEIVAKPEIPV